MKKQPFACSLKVTSQIRGQKALAKGHHGVPWKDLATLLANRDFHCSISWYLSKENCYEFQPTKKTHILDFRQRSVDFLEPITRSGGGRGRDEEKARDKTIYIFFVAVSFGLLQNAVTGTVLLMKETVIHPQTNNCIFFLWFSYVTSRSGDNYIWQIKTLYLTPTF